MSFVDRSGILLQLVQCSVTGTFQFGVVEFALGSFVNIFGDLSTKSLRDLLRSNLRSILCANLSSLFGCYLSGFQNGIFRNQLFWNG